MSDSTATVTASGIASLAGVGRAAVSNWRRRYADFPQPVGGTATSPAFDLRAVENWLQEQGKVPEIPAEERTWRRIEAFGMPEHAGDALSLTGAFLLADASRPAGSRHRPRGQARRRARQPACSRHASWQPGWTGGASYARHLLVRSDPPGMVCPAGGTAALRPRACRAGAEPRKPSSTSAAGTQQRAPFPGTTQRPPR